jgi:PTH1 family peptidyl-tRNA hydrolase
VVVGLGNAERQYARTRHNLGARAVAKALSALGLPERPGLIPVPMSRSGLALPDGYMNDSGALVLKAVERWRPTASGLLIVHDDLDLAFGEVREREGGGHGGHNGLRDIIQRLGSGAFHRVRMGIGRPPPGMGPAEYVLGKFRPEEFASVDAMIEEAAALIVDFVHAPAPTG